MVLVVVGVKFTCQFGEEEGGIGFKFLSSEEVDVKGEKCQCLRCDGLVGLTPSLIPLLGGGFCLSENTQRA